MLWGGWVTPTASTTAHLSTSNNTAVHAAGEACGHETLVWRVSQGRGDPCDTGATHHSLWVVAAYLLRSRTANRST